MRCTGTTRIDNRENTSEDMACNCEAVPPTSSETLSHREQPRGKNTTRMPKYKSGRMIINPSKRAETSDKISCRTVNTAFTEIVDKFADISGASSGKLWIQKNSKWNPQEWRGALEVFPKRPKCSTVYLVKQKNPIYSQMPAAPEGGCKLMGEESTSPTNPEKGRAGNRKTNIKTSRGTCRPVIKSEQAHCPG